MSIVGRSSFTLQEQKIKKPHISKHVTANFKRKKEMCVVTVLTVVLVDAIMPVTGVSLVLVNVNNRISLIVLVLVVI